MRPHECHKKVTNLHVVESPFRHQHFYPQQPKFLMKDRSCVQQLSGCNATLIVDMRAIISLHPIQYVLEEQHTQSYFKLTWLVAGFEYSFLRYAVEFAVFHSIQAAKSTQQFLPQETFPGSPESKQIPLASAAFASFVRSPVQAPVLASDLTRLKPALDLAERLLQSLPLMQARAMIGKLESALVECDELGKLRAPTPSPVAHVGRFLRAFYTDILRMPETTIQYALAFPEGPHTLIVLILGCGSASYLNTLPVSPIYTQAKTLQPWICSWIYRLAPMAVLTTPAKHLPSLLAARSMSASLVSNKCLLDYFCPLT